MSEWHDIEIRDIDLSEDKKDIDILITQNEFGNIWATIKTQDMIDFLKINRIIKE